MKLYTITYSESGETGTTPWHGLDAEHAENRFLDSLECQGGNEGVRILSVVEVRPRVKPLAVHDLADLYTTRRY
jgi:hypothetical protein